MVNKKQVEFLLESGVLSLERHLSIVKQTISGLEVVDHDLLIFCSGGQKLFRVSPRGRGCLLSPHLENVDHLSDIVSRGLD